VGGSVFGGEVVEAAPWVWADRPYEKVLVQTWTAMGVGVDRLGSLDGEEHQGIQDEDQGRDFGNKDLVEDQNQVIPLVGASGVFDAF